MILTEKCSPGVQHSPRLAAGFFRGSGATREIDFIKQHLIGNAVLLHGDLVKPFRVGCMLLGEYSALHSLVACGMVGAIIMAPKWENEGRNSREP